jgi:hypothetical protein
MEGWVNHLLQSVEQVANRMEDGITAIMKGKLPDSEVPSNVPPGLDDSSLYDMDESMMGSPLEGIANEVMKDIISNQVRTFGNIYAIQRNTVISHSKLRNIMLPPTTNEIHIHRLTPKAYGSI